MPAKPEKLFLSYGRADASALADRLAHDLAHHQIAGQPRYTPWKDRFALVAGRSWADQIADALRDTAAMVALMSPHSVRSRADGRSTDDSVCLDEISFARFGARKPIVPVLVAPCTPPFEIFRLDYVDFTQWKTPAEYEAAFARLLDAIAAAARGEIRYRTSADRLQPWDYGNYLAGKREGFVGRRWLFSALKDELSVETRRAILITGGPGFGKSAFIAEYLHRNPDGRVLAFHCCQAVTRETLSPGRFVRSVAAMIASRHPAYEALLDQPPYRDVLTEKYCSTDPASAFEEGVLAALERVGPPRPGRWTLVVDALDEAAEAPGDAPTGIVQLLATRISRFPRWLALVATSRPEQNVLELFANVKPLVIEPTHIANVRDLRRYVTDRLAAPPLADAINASGRRTAWAAKRIGDAAEGNFLYAEQALDALAQGLLRVDELATTALPPGLTLQYRLFFGRRYATDAAWDAARPLFAVLVAAQEPLGAAELAAATGFATGRVLSQQLARLGAYVREIAGATPRYALFHRSLVEWLTGAEEQGGRFAIDAAEGHRLLADGLHATYKRERLKLSAYALAHLPAHLAAAARADAQRRAERQRQLAEFVLDPVLQARRLADPFGMDAALRLALHTVVEGPPETSIPGAIRLALGVEAFRRERLDASRVFDLAAAGELAQSERELQLYSADEQWLNAARLVAAWLAIDKDRAAAGELRARSQTGSVLDERVAAYFERRPARVRPITAIADLHEVTQILLQTGGTEAEGVNPSMLVDQAAPPIEGLEADAEGTRYLAELQAPIMVAFAQQDRTLGSEKLREYIALNAGNAYRVYRNGSLWQILLAVAHHTDPVWVREFARTIVAAALAGRGWEFGGAAPIAAAALRARGGTGALEAFDRSLQRALDATRALAPIRGRGDSWGEWRRSLGAHAQARRVVFGADVKPLLERALAIPPGYAGFQVAACLDLAATLALCGAHERVGAALTEAQRAAHNVQDLVFCARSVSRVHAIRRIWWPAASGDEIAIVDTVERFACDPHAPEFCALHVVGEQYAHRRVANPTSRLPAWLVEARTLESLARVYQFRLGEWQRVNPEIASLDAALAERAAVRVPDPRFAPQLAAWLAARVLASATLSAPERAAAILRLLPVAVADRTELDAVIACLLLAWAPADTTALDDVDAALSSYPLPTMDRAAGPEPLA
ncbi:MAG: TIR domain-containing protein [Betaproteobacteria bacterium]|nr:MAG: TIR domain-containing protein [Betaproteobacteria bacterium]